MTTAIAIYAIGMLFTGGFLLNSQDDDVNDEEFSVVVFMIQFLCAILLWPVSLGILVSDYMFHGDKPE